MAIGYIVGYTKNDFARKTAIFKGLKDESKTTRGTKLVRKIDNNEYNCYYYKHPETACYYCVVHASDSSIEAVKERANKTASSNYNIDKRLEAYYKALARIKNNLVKASDYINGSKIQKPAEN